MWRRVFQGRPCVRCVRCHAAKVHKDENTSWQNKQLFRLRLRIFRDGKLFYEGIIKNANDLAEKAYRDRSDVKPARPGNFVESGKSFYLETNVHGDSLEERNADLFVELRNAAF